jgi:predicted phage-related endonuclease
MEPEARSLYEAIKEVDVAQVGFMVETETNVGYSPDGVTEGLLEIKTQLPHIMAETLDRQQVPTAHKAQIQCGLWVSGKEWLDFMAYWPGMPPFIQRVTRDEDFIKTMESECVRFYEDMAEIKNRILQAA